MAYYQPYGYMPQYGMMQPYQQTGQQMMQSMQQAQNMPRMEITKVNGRGGAEAYMMAPNSSVLLLDESAPIVWLKTTDGAGYPTVTPYSIAPYQAEPQIDVKSLDARISRLEGMIDDKSDNGSPKRKPGKPADGTD